MSIDPTTVPTNDTQAPTAACCSTVKQSTCCDASEKATCCGSGTSGGCGCQ